MVAILGGYGKSRGSHLTKLSLSSALLLSFSDMCFVLCSFIFVVFFLFCFCFVSASMLSLELCRCSSDLFLSNRLRTGLATTYITGYG